MKIKMTYDCDDQSLKNLKEALQENNITEDIIKQIWYNHHDGSREVIYDKKGVIPVHTGTLNKTPMKVVLRWYLDRLLDKIFDTDDDYMNNQRWKK